MRKHMIRNMTGNRRTATFVAIISGKNLEPKKYLEVLKTYLLLSIEVDIPSSFIAFMKLFIWKTFILFGFSINFENNKFAKFFNLLILSYKIKNYLNLS